MAVLAVVAVLVVRDDEVWDVAVWRTVALWLLTVAVELWVAYDAWAADDPSGISTVCPA